MVAETSDVEALVAACAAEVRLGDPFPEEYGYAHLSLCVLDAVFSIGVRYEGVRAVVARYAAWAQLDRVRPGDALPAPGDQQPLGALVEHIEAFTESVVANRQRTSTRSGILKADAVLRFARVLVDHGVEVLQDVESRATDEALDAALRAVPGQGGRHVRSPALASRAYPLQWAHGKSTFDC